MKIFEGKSISDGIAIGKVFLYRPKKLTVDKESVTDTASEFLRFNNAKAKVSDELLSLYDKALKEAGEENASIFEIHRMMIDDLDYIDFISDVILNKGFNAEYAVKSAGEHFENMFSSMDDEYMRARAVDVADISNRLLDALREKKDTIILKGPSIIAADDLTPSETIKLDRKNILGFILKSSSLNSHTAILARAMNIPCLGNIDALDEFDGKVAAIDAFLGKAYMEPNQKTIDSLLKIKQSKETELKAYAKLRGKKSVTLDGKSIKIFCNIASPDDLPSVVENDAEGIGLFRSEFLYIGRKNYPTEEEQFASYLKVAAGMKEKRVIIRTLDIGADKNVDYFNIEKENNPALGYRAIRICLDRVEIFKTQLLALYRASAYGNIAIMFPMITSKKEIIQIKAIIKEVKAELLSRKEKFNEALKLGIMIETPAAALLSDTLAKEVDFFSIGTNDLSQYTLAIDRQSKNLDRFFDNDYLAVLKLIKLTVKNAHKNGIPVGICGEIASDFRFTKKFLRMGIDALSVSPIKVLPLRNYIRNIKLIRQ